LTKAPVATSTFGSQTSWLSQPTKEQQRMSFAASIIEDHFANAAIWSEPLQKGKKGSLGKIDNGLTPRQARS
jgi:hypothetical protein